MLLPVRVLLFEVSTFTGLWTKLFIELSSEPWRLLGFLRIKVMFRSWLTFTVRSLWTKLVV